MIECFLALALLVGDSPELPSKEGLRVNVLKAMRSADCVSFIADISEAKISLVPTKSTTEKKSLRVLMKRPGRFRVERIADGTPEWAVMSDGSSVVEWNSSENTW